MFVSPDELRAASKGVRDLGGSLPPTGADAAANALAGSATTAALGQTEVARRQAESVIRGRFKQIGYLLGESADKYSGTDEDAARRLNAMGDLNPA